MKSILKLLAVVAVLVLAVNLIPAPVGDLASANPGTVGWNKYLGQLSMGIQEPIADAWVIKDGTTYKMWYTRLKLNETTGEILTRLSNMDASGFASDLNNDDFDGAWDRLATLTSAEVLGLLGSATTVIGYATSTDGISWTSVNEQVVAGGTNILAGVGTPTVIKTSDTSYEMWFTQAKSDLSAANWTSILDLCDGTTNDRKTAVQSFMAGVRTVIGYATSTDGITWSVVNNQVLAGAGSLGDSVGAPSVIKDGGVYKMWYTRPKSDLTAAEWAAVVGDTSGYNVDALMGLLDGTAGVIAYATSANGQDWDVVSNEVLPGSTGFWDGVSDPCVVKTADNSYKMWYTRNATNLVRTGISTIWAQIQGFDLVTLMNSLQAGNLEQFLTDVLALDLTTIKSTLASTSTVIGYATSTDGIAWTVESLNDIVGKTGSLWSSVSAPTVTFSGGIYEMWFTEGIDDLTVGRLLDWRTGADFPIGRATTAVTPPPYWPPAAPAPEPGVTSVSGAVDQTGTFTRTVTAPSQDGKAQVTIPQGTKGTTAAGEPISQISVQPMETPPATPTGRNMIGFAYNITAGDTTVTFDQPVTVCLTYDPAALSEGVSEAELVIAVWDETAGAWVELDNITVDTVDKKVCGETTHLTPFAILTAAPAAPTPAAPTPASFQISKLTVMPGEVEIGEHITISCFVENTGDLAGTYKVELMINGEVVSFRDVSLDGKSSVTLSFNITAEAAGLFGVSINGLTGRFTVKAPPVVEAPKGPDIFTSNLSVTPAEVAPGESVTVSVQVANRGDQEGSYLVQLKIDGVVTQTKRVTLAAGASETVEFTVSQNTAGIYLASINDESASFTVKKPAAAPPAGINWALIGGIIGGVAVVAAAVLLLLRRRRSY